MLTKDEMVSQLQEGMREIMFTKTNGNIRHMKCTLNPMLAPKILETKTQQNNPNVIPVWDLEKMQWRSFRVDSILNFSEKD
tara:strand:- start:327 stop:569 length:243 start_codon:yes stop_codon:yes gene_type:complete